MPARRSKKRAFLSIFKSSSEKIPATAIVQASQKLNCGLIVLGTRGMGTVAGLVLGSVASKVVHLADTPVTMVK